MSEEPVLLNVQGPVATIVLNRPERMNTFTPALVSALLGALDAVATAEGVRVVVLTGAGTAFCAGGDLREGLGPMLGDGSRPEQTAQLRASTSAVQRLRNLPQVTVAAINGACAGAGLSLALACDLRITHAKATFATGFLTAGVSGDFGGVWFATRLLGTARAAELYLLNERIDAKEAHRVGLVTKVVPERGFGADVSDLVSSLLSRAPQALELMRANLRDAEDLGLAAYLDVETERQVVTATSSDAAEAAAAFLAKRPPRFTGR